jgi:nitroreductase
MDVFEAITTRRSIREYSEKPVEFDKITAMIEAATHAPSAGNLQDWHFIIVTEKEIRESIANHCMEQYWMHKAPVFIVVCANQERNEIRYGLRGKRLYTIQDCAAATENLLLAAHALGLGACWVGAFDEDFVGDLLKIPSKARAQAIITIGYADGVADEKELVDLVNAVSINEYGNRLEKPHLVLKDYSTEWELQAKKAKPHVQKGLRKISEEVKKLSERVKEGQKKQK